MWNSSKVVASCVHKLCIIQTNYDNLYHSLFFSGALGNNLLLVDGRFYGCYLGKFSTCEVPREIFANAN